MMILLKRTPRHYLAVSKRTQKSKENSRNAENDVYQEYMKKAESNTILKDFRR